MDNTKVSDRLSENEQIRRLFNDLLYVLTNSYYMGKDAHMVGASKEFVKLLIQDFNARVEAQAKAKVEADVKPEGVTSESKA